MPSQQATTSALSGSSSARDSAPSQGSSAAKAGAKHASSSPKVEQASTSTAAAATLAPAKYRLSRLSSDPPSPSKLSSLELNLSQTGNTSPSLLVKRLPRESVLPQPTAPSVIPVSPIFHLEADPLA